MRISKKLAKKLGISAKSKSKYKNKKTVVDGITFDSKKEAERWIILNHLLQDGVIRDLKRQVTIPLVVNGVRVCAIRPDFTYVDCKTGNTVIEDVKSTFTRKNPVYRIKKKLIFALLKVDINEIV